MRRAAVICGLLAAFGTAGASDAHGRAVSLSEARQAPTYLVMLYPGASVSYDPDDGMGNCPHRGGFFSDVSAYDWRGGAIGPQRTDDWSVEYWRHPSGGRVTFDGLTFRNRTHRKVLVAGWCG